MFPAFGLIECASDSFEITDMNKITMTAGLSLSERRLTLLMIGLLHAFTHIYQVALIPLYFGISKDLKLKDIDQATLLVSVMMLAYFLPSYPLGVLGDRWSRKRLLTIGLLINALGFIVLSWAPSYGWAIVAVAISGFGGSFFHPAATALTVQLFPESPGRALGQMAIGASVGFFFGPLYAGWRGQGAGWRQPTLELGLMGLVGAVLFAVLAAENRVKPSLSHKADSPRLFSGIAPAVLFVVMAIGFSCRDFAGSARRVPRPASRYCSRHWADC